MVKNGQKRKPSITVYKTTNYAALYSTNMWHMITSGPKAICLTSRPLALVREMAVGNCPENGNFALQPRFSSLECPKRYLKIVTHAACWQCQYN